MSKPANLPFEDAKLGVLRHLAVHGRTAVIELRKQRVPYGNYAKLVRALEADGLAKVTKRDDDTRRHLELTPKGHKAAATPADTTAKGGV